MRPQVSIIIATLNSGATLDSALGSIVAQSYQNWECIIVDGLSQDDTIDIILKYTALDTRFRYISEPDTGIYDALNKGVGMACGEWIHCLGSDDELTEDGISELMSHADDYDVVCGSTYIIFPNGTINIQHGAGIGGCHQSMIIRKSVIEELNGFDLSYRILADHKMLRQIERRHYRVCCIDTCISYFSMTGVSQSLRYQMTICRERARIGKECGDRHPVFDAVRIMIRKIGSIIKRKAVIF